MKRKIEVVEATDCGIVEQVECSIVKDPASKRQDRNSYLELDTYNFTEQMLPHTRAERPEVPVIMVTSGEVK